MSHNLMQQSPYQFEDMFSVNSSKNSVQFIKNKNLQNR